jgi:uncharacterized membrane protein YbhN (UPF0104 family)
METNCNINPGKFKFEEIFSKKEIRLKSFYIHAFIYAVCLVVFILKQYYGVPLNFFPLKYLNSVVMVIWTTVFLFAAIDLFTSLKIFGEEWEKRKLKSILEKKYKKQKWE